MHQPIIEKIGLILFILGWAILFAAGAMAYYNNNEIIKNEMKKLKDEYKKDW